MPPGSPFGPNLRAFALYLRFGQAIPFARLAQLMGDLFDLTISEGALANLMQAAAPAFARQARLIKARLLEGTILQSDETSARVGKQTYWIWVFHHQDSACFVMQSLQQAGGRDLPRRAAAALLGLRPLRRPARLGDARSSVLPGASHPRGALCRRGGRRDLRAAV